MFVRYLQNSRVVLQRLGTDFKILKKCGYGFPLISLINIHNFKFSRSSLLYGASFGQILEKKDTLSSFSLKINEDIWSEALNKLNKASYLSASEYPEKNSLFQKSETRFLQKELAFITPEQVIILAGIFRRAKSGSMKFWKVLTEKFSDFCLDNKYQLHQIAQFMFSAQDKYPGNIEFWEYLEKKILELGPQRISVTTLSQFLSALSTTYLTEIDPFEMDPNEKQIGVDDLKSNQLWIIFKELAVKKLKNASPYDLSILGRTFHEVNLKDEGFWSIFEERFNEINHLLNSEEIFILASIIGRAKKGSKRFWDDIETYALTTIDYIVPDELSLLVQGLAFSEEGSSKLWSKIQNYILIYNGKFSAESIGGIAYSLALYEIAKPQVWQILENKALECIKEFNYISVQQLILGFGKAKRGDVQLWSAIEDAVISLEDSNREKRFELYTAVKSVNKLTGKLSSYFHDVSEVADRWVFTEASNEEDNINQREKQN